jgi:hypothetical protein
VNNTRRGQCAVSGGTKIDHDMSRSEYWVTGD